MTTIGRHSLMVTVAGLALTLIASAASADPRCGSRTVQVTPWGQNWTQVNLSTLLTLSDESGANASHNANYIDVSVDYDLEYFTIMIGGVQERLSGGEHQTFRIAGPTNTYSTTITWCRRQ